MKFVLLILFLCFFFFKQKTAYEMRISDWSSDVCSSDLCRRRPAPRTGGRGGHALLLLFHRHDRTPFQGVPRGAGGCRRGASADRLCRKGTSEQVGDRYAGGVGRGRGWGAGRWIAGREGGGGSGQSSVRLGGWGE